MRIQKLWIAVAGVLLVALLAMAAEASRPRAALGANAPSSSASFDPTSPNVTPPPVPDDIKVPAGNKAYLVGHAVGTQNYVCLPSGSGFAFVLFTPQATLFDDQGKQIITHYFSPNLSPSPNQPPSEKGTIRATWQDSKDTSTIWAKATGSVPGATGAVA